MRSFLKSARYDRVDPALAGVAFAVWLPIAALLVPVRISDRGIFVSVAARLLAGDALYSGVYDNKEPLFYYFVASQLALGPWAEVAAEGVLIAIAAAAAYVTAVKVVSPWTAAALSSLAVPIILTGASYLPGYTELPGIAFALAAIAASADKRPLLAGSCIGLLAFMKLTFVPIAVMGVLCFVLMRQRSFDALVIALGAILSGAVVVGALLMRGELAPFIETIALNVSYSQGSLVDSKEGLAALAEHLSCIGLEPLGQAAAPILLAILVMGLVLWRKDQPGRMMVAIAGTCLATFIGSLLVLSITGFWEHHLQILYISSIFAVLGLAPLIDLAASFHRLPALGLIILAGYLLAGAPALAKYIQSFNGLYASYAGLTERSPEAQRLLAIGNTGIYARFGTNDDQGHADGLQSWKLACPRFHQYYFEQPAMLNRVFECASRAPTLIISANFEPNTLPAWNEFVARVEALLKEKYSCDARKRLRICRRHASEELSFGRSSTGLMRL